MTLLAPVLAALDAVDLARVGTRRAGADAASEARAEFGALGDEALLALVEDAARARRRLDALTATMAAEIARRSTRDLGHAGLAQRLGARTPDGLVQRITGGTSTDARQLVGVGRLIASESSPLGAAVRHGSIGVAAAAAIAGGLGAPSERVSPAALDAAARDLVDGAAGTTVEQLRARAREVRDDLDAAGVVDRERELRARRYLHLYPQDDGMTRMVGLLDPESAAQVVAVVDAATSPRRGGPRFVDPADRARATAIETDDRTTPQLALDAIVTLLAAGAAADSGRVLGRRGAPVQVLVTAADLRAGSGVARIEGQPAAVSVATAERRACSDGVTPITIGALGQVLDVGRTQRLFTRRQRIALAIRDGGCRFPGCDRPPSWCEAHHITPWSHGGRTDTADGVLLCRHHHLLLHDNGWRIQRRVRRDEPDQYDLIPPTERDPLQRAIGMPPNSRTLDRATRQEAAMTG